jgi:hypothetical protein
MARFSTQLMLIAAHPKGKQLDGIGDLGKKA